MTTTVTVHVNGNYRATVTHSTVDEFGNKIDHENTEVGPGEVRTLNHMHGSVNLYGIEETPVSQEQPAQTAEDDDPPAA